MIDWEMIDLFQDTLISKWNVQWVALKPNSVLFETGEPEAGNVLLR